MQTVRLFSVASMLVICKLVTAFDITAVGVVDLSSPSIELSGTSQTTESKVGFGFGGLVSLYSTTTFTLEGGLLSISRKYALSSVPTSTIGLSMLEIPLLLRFDLLPIIAVSAGTYVALGMGDVSTTTAITTTTQTWDASNLSKTDFGLQACVSLALPVLPTLKFLIDLRYLYGIANLSTTNTASFKFRDIQLLGGLRFSL